MPRPAAAAYARSPFAKGCPIVDDDLRLMLGFREGNVRDFEALMSRHQRSIINLAFRFIGDRAAAEDVAQEVFLQVFRSAAGYRPSASFTTWLYTIARNACYSELRRRRLRPGSLDAEAGSQPAASPPANPVESAELRAAVRRAVASLPEAQRMAVILCRYDGLSYEQIAEAMNTSVGSVKSLLHRARLTLREALKDKC